MIPHDSVSTVRPPGMNREAEREDARRSRFETHLAQFGCGVRVLDGMQHADGEPHDQRADNAEEKNETGSPEVGWWRIGG